MKRAHFFICNEQVRLTVAAVLVKNGYSVRSVVEYWREEE